MSTPPNKKTADDMLKAAQDRAAHQPVRSRESREVVVRKDGSKVVKVRRRKRKSQAPADVLQRSEEQTKKFYIKLTLILIGVGIFASLAFGLIFFFKVAYFNSPNYITELENGLKSKLRSEVKLEGYRLGPTASVIDKVSLLSNKSSIGEVSLELKNLQLSHRPESVVFGRLTGEDAQAEEGTLHLQLTKGQDELVQSQSNLEPKIQYDYQSLNIEKANVLIEGAQSGESLSVKDASSRVLLREDGLLQTFIRNGTMVNTPGLPKLLNSAIIIHHEDSYEVKALKLGNGSTGLLSISGNITKDLTDTQILKCDFDQLRIEESNDKVADLMEACVSSEGGTLTMNSASQHYTIAADVSLSAAGFSLKGFEFLSSFAELFGDFSYPYVAFRTRNKVSLDINKERYAFKNIYFEQQGLLAISGEIHISFEGALSGKIKVGIPTAKIAKQYPELDVKHLEDSRGYLWFDTTLSGTTLIPRDDFKEEFNKVAEAL